MVTIVKSKLHRDYTIIPNEILRRKDISLSAKGLFCYIQSLPEDWVIYKNRLKDILGESRRQIDNAFAELEEKGYLICSTVIRNNIPQKEYIFYQFPFNEYPQNTDAQNGQRYAQNGQPLDAQNEHSPDAQNGQLLSTNSNTLNTNYYEEEKKLSKLPMFDKITNIDFLQMCRKVSDQKGRLTDLDQYKKEYFRLLANRKELHEQSGRSEEWLVINAKKFIKEQSAINKEYDNYADFFSHFLNWTRKQPK